MSAYEVGALVVLGVLGVANAIKAAERARATLQIATMYHTARVSNPESLGADPDEAKKKVEGFLQKTIWAALFHAANMVVCGAVGWIVWAGSAEPFKAWRGLVLVLTIISAFGSVGAVWELAAGLLDIRKVRRSLEELDLGMSDERRAELKTGPLVPLAIAQYGLTGAAAGYLAVVLYRVGG